MQLFLTALTPWETCLETSIWKIKIWCVSPAGSVTCLIQSPRLLRPSSRIKAGPWFATGIDRLSFPGIGKPGKSTLSRALGRQVPRRDAVTRVLSHVESMPHLPRSTAWEQDHTIQQHAERWILIGPLPPTTKTALGVNSTERRS